MEWWEYVLYFVALGSGWIMAYYFHPKITQRLTLRKELAADYLVDFKKWSHVLYRELVEFKNRYPDLQVYNTLSRILIIIDYRELHDVLREQGKYLGKIEKENSGVAEYLRKLEDLVDNLWHSSQDEFSVNFDQAEHDEWMKAIIKYRKKEKLVEFIKDNSGEILNHFKAEEFEKAKNYVLDQIPKWYRVR